MRIGRPSGDAPRAFWSAVTAGDQRRQREDAALALIVGAHDDDDVFDRDDEEKRVEHEREDTEHVLVARRHRVGSRRTPRGSHTGDLSRYPRKRRRGPSA